MNFDLNIDNYKPEELIEMFELPHNFDNNMLEMKEAKLRESIMKNTDISKDTQQQTLQFIVKAKNIILNTSPKNGVLQKKIEDFYNSSYELKPSMIEDTTEHMVQVRENKPYLSSFPSEYFTGVINPLKKRTLKKNLNIDTRFRENYYSSPSTNFNVTLPTTFNNVLEMQLATIELPTTFYVVSEQYGNNFFTISIIYGPSLVPPYNTPTPESYVITIPDGNYDQTTIISAINNQLQTYPQPIGSPFLLSYLVFNVCISNGTTGSGQTVVGVNNTIAEFYPPLTLELNFQADKFGNDDRNTPLPLKFGWILGFRNGIYSNYTSPPQINNLNNENSNSLNIVSEGLLDTTGPRYFYLVLDDYNNNVNNSFFSAFNSSILNKNILARISLTGTTFGILEQNNLNIITTPRQYFGPVNLQNLNIQLLDEYGRIVNLNNMDFSFCLTLTTVYDL